MVPINQREIQIGGLRMPTAFILQLVPRAGKQLADVAHIVDFNGIMFTALLGALMDERPQLVHKMLVMARVLKALPGVTPDHQTVFDSVINVIEQMIAAEER
jgi:hypothetical protein